MIKINHLSKYYFLKAQVTKALADINLTFNDEGMVFIVGKSGSGKSTLLNLLGGLDSPSQGEIIIDNKPLSAFKGSDFDAYRNSTVGIIFQTFNLLEDKTVFENIALSLKIAAKNHNLDSIEDALKSVGMEGLGYRQINELSGGQKQRVAIARVLVKNPKIILADEPTGSLDSTTGEDIVSTLKAISKEKLVIVVTHDQNLAQKYGDRIIEIKDGQVVKDIVKKKLTISNSEFITSRVIKVPIGGKLTKLEEINKRLTNNKDNYICITQAYDKVALAHPECFTTIYEKQDYEQDFIEVNNNEQEFKSNLLLKKSFLPLKEALKMAFESLKKKKIRFLTLIFLATIALTMYSLASSLAMITHDSILASTIKANNEQLISVKKTSVISSYYTENDYDKIHQEVNGIKYAKAIDVKLQVESSTPPSISEYYFRYFQGIIECDDIANLGLITIAGNGKFNLNDDYQTIIISDYVASELIRQGFLGVRDDVYGIYFPLNFNELINMKIIFKDGLSYKIKGIFQTDYLNMSQTQNYNFKTLKDLFYARAITKEGFAQNHLAMMEYYFKDLILQYNFIPTSGDVLTSTVKSFYTYNKSELESRLIVGELPETLQENQVVVDFNLLTALSGRGYIESEQDLIDHWNWYNRLFFLPSFKLKVSQNNQEIYSSPLTNFKIVAVVRNANPKGQIFLNPNTANTLKINSFLAKEIITSPNITVTELGRIIATLNHQGYKVQSSILTNFSNDSFELNNIAQIANIAAFICGGFAILLIFNFIYSSIRGRKKEIGILRSCGARPFDIIKIFLSEVLIVASIVVVLSLILTLSGYEGINLIVSTKIVKGMNVITFKLQDAILIIGLCYGLMGAVALYPILNISYLKPIEAINDKAWGE